MGVTVVSLSGGKDSTAMLLMLLERGERVDDVIVYDTGMEFPEMYEHLDRLEDYTGMRFTRLRMEPGFEHQMFVHRKTMGNRKGEPGYAWPTPMARWCTARKTSAIDKRVSEIGGGRWLIASVSPATRIGLSLLARDTRSSSGESPRMKHFAIARNAGSIGVAYTTARSASRAGAVRFNRSMICVYCASCIPNCGQGCVIWTRWRETGSERIIQSSSLKRNSQMRICR